VTESLANQLQRLRAQLPPLNFMPRGDPTTKDWSSLQLPGLEAYLSHYGLKDLSDSVDSRHVFGTIKCCGYTIAGHYWLPLAPAGTVFVVHGYFDHAGLYGHLIRYLLAKNLAVVIFDLPGHGLSDGEQVSIASFDHYVEVFDAVLTNATILPRPWHAVGQSTGGAIVLKHLLQEAYKDPVFENIALLAPLLHPRLWQYNRLIYLAAHRFFPQIKRHFQINSGDPAFVDFLSQNDPLQARHIPLEWIGAMKQWTKEFHQLPESDFPVHVVQGNQDATLDWRYNLRQISKKLPGASVHIIDGAQHHLVNEVEHLRTLVFTAMGFNHKGRSPGGTGAETATANNRLARSLR
jgi:alpha-beta hydrolase superfamily lysophospholipase